MAGGTNKIKSSGRLKKGIDIIRFQTAFPVKNGKTAQKRVEYALFTTLRLSVGLNYGPSQFAFELPI
ncbi:hypothetical protein ACTHTQ_10150 [Neisseria sp. P0020.S003]|uniref:hypothetical protein n=1 Tax=Neisseria sp. P0020.S003 TaxID=3436808 RepID=UPI003F7E9FE2